MKFTMIVTISRLGISLVDGYIVLEQRHDDDDRYRVERYGERRRPTG